MAGASIALVIVNGTMILGNQSAQAEVNRRQQFINQSVQLSRVNEALVRALVAASNGDKDAQIKELLAKHGINTAAGAPAPAATSGGKR